MYMFSRLSIDVVVVVGHEMTMSTRSDGGGLLSGQ